MLLWRASMMHLGGPLRALVLGAGVLGIVGCAVDKDPIKGRVDQSAPPTGSPDAKLGKADESSRIVPIAVESAHPYAINTHDVRRIDLSLLPGCASRARLYFDGLRTEASYDYVIVRGAVASDTDQSFDGNHDGTWSSWFYLDESRYLEVVLDTDYSINDYGYRITKVEWEGSPLCPAVVWPPCASGSIDINATPGVCQCRQQPTCVAVDDVEIRHNVARGFQNSGNKIAGNIAYSLAPGPADGLVATRIGTVNGDAVARLVSEMAAAGVFVEQAYSRYGETTEYFYLRAGSHEVSWAAPVGTHEPEVAAWIARFEELLGCDGPSAHTTCDSGNSCVDGTCQASCVCTQQYNPVCGSNGRTYSNSCFSGCASGVTVAHLGECGIEGDPCGTILGLTCQPNFKCKYADSGFDTPYPDEGGSCVSASACETPAHCTDLVHPAVPGAWACVAGSCQWQAGSSWLQVQGSTFETTNPYANHENRWHQLYLPAGARGMRLVQGRAFDLEAGYDYLEVWSWDGAKWVRNGRYTGTEGPTSRDVFPGRYHWLHFVSDYSVTRSGFSLSAEYTQDELR